MGKNNHNADIKNANKGNPGVNKTFAQNQGNRGKQLNPIPNDANNANKGNLDINKPFAQN